MRLMTLTASILLSLAIANISNAANPLSAASNTITACNRIGTNGTPMCPAPTPTNQDNPDTNRAGGNPINLLTGNKFESATDIEATGGEYALRLNRYYNSRSTQRGLFGKGWRSDYEMQLQDTGDKIDVLQADGRKISFTKTADKLEHSSLLITRYKADKAELGYLERTQSTDTSKPAWIWHLPNGKQLQFVAHKQSSIVNSDGRYRFGQLSRVTENINQPNSAYWSLTYDVKGSLAQVQNHQGDTLKFSYQTTKYNLPKIIITKSGRNNSGLQIWQYFLDKQGNLVQIVSPAGNRTGYAYTDPNDLHNLTAKYSYDKQGNKQLITKWSYDAYDRAISSAHQNGVEKVTISFDPDTLIPMPADHIFTNIITNSVGETTEYNYRFRGDQEQLISVKGAGCATCGPTNVSYEYDNAGRVIKENKLDDEGEVVSTTQREFDKIGRIIKVVQSSAQGEQTWQSYAYGNPDYPMQPTTISRPSVVKGREAQVKLSYDERGNVVSMTEVGYRPATINKNEVKPLTRITKYNYELINGKSLLTAVDGPLPSSKDTTRYHYNGKSQIVSIAYPEGLTQNMSYDDQGRLTALKDIDNTTSTYQYDAQGQITQTNQNGQTTTISYDPMGRIAQVTDPLGQILSYQYNSAGQLISMGDKTQAQIDLIRDKEGNLTAANLLVDGKVEQKKTFETIDNDTKQALLSSIQQIAEGQTGNSARPDININPYQQISAVLNQSVSVAKAKLEQSDVDGLITTYTQDDMGNIIAVDSPTTGITTYKYDENNLLIGSQSPLNTQTYQRDSIGRITDIQVTSMDGIIEQHHIEWGAHNKPIKITYPTGFETFSYNDAGKLKTHTQNIDNKTFTLTYKYDNQDRVASKKLPSGEVIKYTYNGSDKKKVGVLNSVELKGLWNKPIISGLNSDDDTSINQSFTFGNGISNSLQKDSNGRIVLAGNPKVGQTVLNYSGNKTTEPTTVNQTYSAQLGDAIHPNQGIHKHLEGALDKVLHGRSSDITAPVQTDIIEQIYQLPKLDKWGRTIQQGDQHYEYDSQNRLTKITHTDATGRSLPVAEYRYNTFNQRIAKTTYNNQGAKTKNTYYFYNGNQLVAETTDEASKKADNLKQYIWLNDTPIAVLQQGDLFYIHTDHRNAPIAVTDKTSKLVWQATNEDFGFAHINRQSEFELNLRLSNQYYDSESGLHYNTNRYYDPVNLRYNTTDPLGLAAGPDLFAFALNQPHSVSDPDGLDPQWNLPTDREVAGWNNEQKIGWVFNYAAGFFGSDVKSALRELVSPSSIATTAAVFGVWAVAQFTPYGWAADIALAGIGGLLIGKAIIDVINGLYKASKILKPTCKATDLLEAGESIRKAVKAATQSLATGAGALAGARIAKLFRTIFKDRGHTATQAKRAANDQKRYGTFKPGRTRAGYKENAEAKRRAESAGYGDAFRPPWSKWKTVTDTWLNPGEKVYMLVNKGATPTEPGLGGWVSPDKFSNLKEARQKLALLPDFKQDHECCDLVELIVKTPIPVRSGTVGSLISRENGALYRGGARQSELLINLRDDKWRNYFRVNDIKKEADLK